MVMGIKARTSNSNSNNNSSNNSASAANSKDLAGNSKIKSHSVENLMDPTSSVLGLKSANSETLLNYNNYARRRLSGTTSELNVNRIGTSEKVKVFETLEGVTSLPVELTKGLSKGQVKPNRDKIRAILSMSSVIELQRHLLTTVMENEVRFLIINFYPVVHFKIPYITSDLGPFLSPYITFESNIRAQIYTGSKLDPACAK